MGRNIRSFHHHPFFLLPLTFPLPSPNLVVFLRRPEQIFLTLGRGKNIRTITFCLTKDLANGDVYTASCRYGDLVHTRTLRSRHSAQMLSKSFSALRFLKGRRHAFRSLGGVLALRALFSTSDGSYASNVHIGKPRQYMNVHDHTTRGGRSPFRRPLNSL